MATSGYIETDYALNFGIGYRKARLTWSRRSYSVENNTSTIGWSLIVMGDAISVWLEESCHVNINGEAYELNSVTFELSQGGIATILSGTETIQHNANGSASFAYSFDISHFFSVFKASGTAMIDVIPRPINIVSAADFNDEDNPTITYNSPSGNAPTAAWAIISLTGRNDDVKYSLTKNGSSFTFPLTDDERDRLRMGVSSGDSTTVRFIVRTKIDEKYYDSYITKTLTLINYLPTLNPTIKDINADTTALTGNNQTIVRYVSDVEFNTGASPQKMATIESQTVKCGSRVVEDTTAGTMNDITNHIFTFDMVDNRGYTAHEEIEATFIPYVNLTAVLNVEELTLDGNLTFSISGNYFNGNFGLRNNELSVVYMLEKNGQLIDTITLNPTEQGTLDYGLDTYKYKYTITGLVLEEADRSINSYTLQAVVNDLLTPAITTDKITSSGTPIFDWGKDDFVFNVPVLFGRGFTNNIGLKTAYFVRSLTMNAAGSYDFCDLSDLGISNDNEIYSITGAISYNGKVYPIPSPAISAAGLNNIADATKFWIDGTTVKITIAAAWGTAAIRILISYF
jgi:hypothetical protein